jgi:hypothetical protein
MPQDDLKAQIDHLRALKEEHAPLLSMIAGDPGMSADVRRALVEHIYEEEDEHMTKLAALTGGGAGSTPPAPAAAAHPAAAPNRGLSVGSLRVDHPSPSPTSVGSLRAASPHGGSVGSLRRPH